MINTESILMHLPPPGRVAHEMDVFLDWLNCDSPLDLILKAGIAHLWFVTVHPFDDGNGRIGRAIIDYFLAKSEASSQRFYSLSSQIQQEEKEYYRILEETQKGNLDITLWIEWFIDCLGRAIHKAKQELKEEDTCSSTLRHRQNKYLNNIVEADHGKLKRLIKPTLGFKSLKTAYATIKDLKLCLCLKKAK